VGFGPDDYPIPKILKDQLPGGQLPDGAADISFEACSGGGQGTTFEAKVATYASAWKTSGSLLWTGDWFTGQFTGTLKVCYLYLLKPIVRYTLTIPMIASEVVNTQLSLFLCVEATNTNDGASADLTGVVSAENCILDEGCQVEEPTAMTAVQGRYVHGNLQLSGTFTLGGVQIVDNQNGGKKITWSTSTIGAQYSAILKYGAQAFVELSGEVYEDTLWTANLVYDTTFDAASAAAASAAETADAVATNTYAAALVAESETSRAATEAAHVARTKWEGTSKEEAAEIAAALGEQGLDVATYVANNPEAAADDIRAAANDANDAASQAADDVQQSDTYQQVSSAASSAYDTATSYYR
jgi:hypothetical protein